MAESADNRRAVVLLSGGLDSATCLAIAQDAGYDCVALSFDYGQRSRSELTAARHIAATAGADHRLASVNLDSVGGSALTDPDIAVPDTPSDGIPDTYVPARNTIFLSIALGWAEILEAEAIFIGVNAVDYSGYPDCRPEFIAAFERLAQLATRAGTEDGQRLAIRTPLMDLSKADIIRCGTTLGVDYGATLTCYQADDDGRACGVCDACRLRRAGFVEAGIADPTRYMGAPPA